MRETFRSGMRLYDVVMIGLLTGPWQGWRGTEGNEQTRLTPLILSPFVLRQQLNVVEADQAHVLPQTSTLPDLRQSRRKVLD